VSQDGREAVRDVTPLPTRLCHSGPHQMTRDSDASPKPSNNLGR
jgi:hypothetical protein